MNKYELIQAVKQLAYEVEGRVVEGYSGRGMYGKECYGVAAPNYSDDAHYKIKELGLGVPRIEALGKGVIMYWPYITKITAEYNHMLDVAFTVVSEKANWEDLTVDEMIEGLRKRLAHLESCKEEAIEAFGHCDTFGVNDLNVDEEEAQ